MDRMYGPINVWTDGPNGVSSRRSWSQSTCLSSMDLPEGARGERGVARRLSMASSSSREGAAAAAAGSSSC